MNYKTIYAERLVDGLEYQDFIAEQLYSIGLPLFSYSSKKYQIEKGENKLGVEIKFDRMMAKTGRIWIETAEKSNPRNPSYVSSGIFRTDNTWLYVIGDRSKVFIFSKKLLRQLHDCNKYRIMENGTKTSKGFLMPVTDAEKYSARIIEIVNSDRRN